MRERSEWRGSPTDLLAELDALADRTHVDLKSKSWPKAAHRLSRRLNEISTNLAEIGIVITTGERTTSGRSVRMERSAGSSVIGVTGDANPAGSTLTDDASDDATDTKRHEASSPEAFDFGANDASDANDAISGTSSPPSGREVVEL